MLSLREIMGPEGILAKSMSRFEFRPSQIHMAELIQKAIETKTSAIAEAGTGTGKTLAYLIPSILSGKKVMVSTGTKNLQDQIFLKDIPMLSEVLGVEIDALLMKGRRNYLCLRKLKRYGNGLIARKIRKWLETTEFADRAEITWMEDDDPEWWHLSSSSDQCKGRKCPYRSNCYISKLRERAETAQVIIVNHDLFFADLSIRASRVGKILPKPQVIIFDEAHKVEKVAAKYFGDQFTTTELHRVAEESADGLTHLFSAVDQRGKLTPDMIDVVRPVMLPMINKEIQDIEDEDRQIRAERLRDAFEAIFSPFEDNHLRWYERDKYGEVEFRSVPLDVAPYLAVNLFERIDTVIFASATLSTNNNFEYFKSRLGVPVNARMGIYPSHFDFLNKTRLFLPTSLPYPNEPTFADSASKLTTELLKISKGRALMLFTSYRNMNKVYDALVDKVPYNIMKQGDAPKMRLIEQFKSDTHSVLLATSSFWQGVDIPGETLSCLIIDKLPFDVPNDPLVAAQIESIQKRGGNPFAEYQLPTAIITLKQGLGRLIRSDTDRGVFAILDKRLLTQHYGALFLNSMPGIPHTSELSEISQFMGGF